MFASHDFNGSAPAAHPCPGFPVAVLFPDVEPEVLAREAASEAARAGRPDAGGWHAYLRRLMLAPGRHAPVGMARALVTGGTGAAGSRPHAVLRARFRADEADEIGRI